MEPGECNAGRCSLHTRLTHSIHAIAGLSAALWRLNSSDSQSNNHIDATAQLGKICVLRRTNLNLNATCRQALPVLHERDRTSGRHSMGSEGICGALKTHPQQAHDTQESNGHTVAHMHDESISKCPWRCCWGEGLPSPSERLRDGRTA